MHHARCAQSNTDQVESEVTSAACASCCCCNSFSSRSSWLLSLHASYTDIRGRQTDRQTDRDNRDTQIIYRHVEQHHRYILSYICAAAVPPPKQHTNVVTYFSRHERAPKIERKLSRACMVAVWLPAQATRWITGRRCA